MIDVDDRLGQVAELIHSPHLLGSAGPPPHIGLHTMRGYLALSL